MATESSSDEESPLAQVVSSAVTGLTLVVAFGLSVVGIESFWVVFVVGFGGVLPLSLALVQYYQETDDQPERNERSTERPTETEDALDELRQRYARGEFSDEEFDRRVERLLETESVHDARQYAERTETQRDREIEDE
ncbi:SHOCT domain-containing protein [Halovenus rubra]|uniref:SHOCT domain-containing protein n=2 Tax=Halovenus rubra TaxID=869890 RepID=A0ACC7E222_9EURY|nr:SHOCT domain-containing protein [Halovenus rubra]